MGLTKSWEQVITTLDALPLQMGPRLLDSHIQAASFESATHTSTALVAERCVNYHSATIDAIEIYITQERKMIYGIPRLPDEVLFSIFAEVVEIEREEINKKLMAVTSPFTSEDISIIRNKFHVTPFNIASA